VKIGPAAVLSAAEVERVICACRGRGPTTKRNLALVTLLYRTGLRCGECISLQRASITLVKPPDEGQSRLLVREGKGGGSRVVGLHQDVVVALERWLAVAPDSDLVFCTLQGTRLDDGYVRAMLRRKAIRAGVGRCHPHAFRATLAVELVSEGVPLPAVRDVLGHHSIATTDLYLRRVFPEMAISAVIDR
jgi:site-specific recombinase XerD